MNYVIFIILPILGVGLLAAGVEKQSWTMKHIGMFLFGAWIGWLAALIL